jgi:hypothetical protein
MIIVMRMVVKIVMMMMIIEKCKELITVIMDIMMVL